MYQYTKLEDCWEWRYLAVSTWMHILAGIVFFAQMETGSRNSLYILSTKLRHSSNQAYVTWGRTFKSAKIGFLKQSEAKKYIVDECDWEGNEDPEYHSVSTQNTTKLIQDWLHIHPDSFFLLAHIPVPLMHSVLMFDGRKIETPSKIMSIPFIFRSLSMTIFKHWRLR